MLLLVSLSWCLYSCVFHGRLVGVSVDTLYPGLPPGSSLGAMFLMGCVIWAMADDELLFKFMAEISPRTKTLLTATLTSGVGAGETLTRMF